MPRFNFRLLAGLMMALSAAHLAEAQTSAVANLTVQSGNGMAACLCNSATLNEFNNTPISVKATDINGHPVSGATVTWTSANMSLGPLPTSQTDANGIATENITLAGFYTFTTPYVPFIVSTVQAMSNNSSVTFTETQSLITTQAVSVIEASAPTYGGNPMSNLPGSIAFSANAGSTSAIPIQVLVGGVQNNFAANGVGNVSVSLLNEQTSPTLTCAPGGAGNPDPGTVLSLPQAAAGNPQGEASCFPVFHGSGTATFWVLIGAQPGGTDITNAMYLQAFGPYTFTSIPGNPTAFNLISGNYQVANFGVQLNPLVAQLVDSNGNPVQGQTVVWTINPPGAAALNAATSVTDNNGEVTNGGTLFRPASAGATITATVQNYPNLSVTFSVTVPQAITALNIIGGNPQNAQVGSTFSQPLTVQVLSSGTPVANYPVMFTASSGVTIQGATQGVATVGSNLSGDASVTVVAGGTTGAATVTATVGTLTATFNLTVTGSSTGPTATTLSIVSGTPQSAKINAAFAAPLVVEVTGANNTPVSGVLVGFTSTGNVTLSSGVGTTGANGQTSVTVTAGSTAGAATVTASVTGLPSQTFNLTINPPGPTITGASFLNGASRQPGFISPCSLAILSAPGVTPDGVADYALPPIFGRYPKSVHGLSVTFNGIAAPIVSVAMGATNPEVTLQVPCEVTPGNSVPVVVNVNGGGTASANIPILTVSPGIFTAVQSDGVSRAVVVRQDGSFANIGGTDPYDPDNPVRQSENVLFYLTGLGATNPSVGTDSIENPLAYVDQVEALVAGTVQAGIVGGSGLQVISARQAPDLIGVYEVQVAIPGSAPVGNSIPIAIGVIPAGSSSNTPGIFGTVNPIIAIGQ